MARDDDPDQRRGPAPGGDDPPAGAGGAGGGMTSGDPLAGGAESAFGEPRPGGAESAFGGREGGSLWSGGAERSGDALPGDVPPSAGTPPSGGWAPPGGAPSSPPPAGGWAPPGGQHAHPAPWPGPPAQAGGQQTLPPYGGAGATENNGTAITSLACGIAGLVVCPLAVLSIVALVTGYKAKREIETSQGRQTGRGVAIAGIVTGWLGLLWSVLVLTLLAAALFGMSLIEPEDLELDPALVLLALLR